MFGHVFIIPFLVISLIFLNFLQCKFIPAAKINSISISIKPISCQDKQGNNGVCMFKLACIQANGTPIGICKDNSSIYTGSCCRFSNHQTELGTISTSTPSSSISSNFTNVTLKTTIASLLSKPSSFSTSSSPSFSSSFLSSTSTSSSEFFLSSTSTFSPSPFSSTFSESQSIPYHPLSNKNESKPTSPTSIFTQTIYPPFEVNNIVIVDNHAQSHGSGRPHTQITPPSLIVTSSVPSSTNHNDTTNENTLVNVTEASVSLSLVSSTNYSSSFSTTGSQTVSSLSINTNHSLQTSSFLSSITGGTSSPSSTETFHSSSQTYSTSTSAFPLATPLSSLLSSTTSAPFATILSSSTRPSITTISNEMSTQSSIKSICGRKISQLRGRIVGGTKSYFSEWPWMVSLRQWKKNAFLHKCGAALLNEYWAITAAHCVENVASTDLLLRLGEYDVSNEDEPYSHIERRVQIIAPHPKFDPRTFEYDLALLRFFDPVPLRKNIIPVCLPENNNSYVGHWATVTGWGRLYEDGPLPNTLQHVKVPVITNKECEVMYRKAGYIEEIPHIFICAGVSNGGKDSCEGDSGGPLVIEEKDQWNLIGIISWGIGCALPNQPGVYTRITEFSKWINQIIAY